MNIEELQNQANNIGLNLEFVNSQIFIQMIETEDNIGCILRGHFVIENFLNIYVSDRVGVQDFFNFRINFNEKLKIAERLGIKKEIYSSIKVLNNIRNDLAHKHQHVITTQTIENFKNTVNQIKLINDSFPDINHMKIQLFDKDNQHISKTYDFTSGDGRIKLIIIIALLIQKLNYWLHQDALSRRGISVV